MPQLATSRKVCRHLEIDGDARIASTGVSECPSDSVVGIAGATIPSVDQSYDMGQIESIFTDRKTIAELLNVNARTVERLQYDAGLPFHRFGRCVRYKVSEVLEWADRQTEQG